MSETAAVLRALAAPLRRRAALGWGLGVAGALGLALGVAAWAARLGWLGEPWWVLVTWPLVAGLGGLAGGLAWRAVAARTPDWLATVLERTGFREGALRGHLEPAAPGTSAELLALADRRQAVELAQRAPAELAELRRSSARVAVRGGVVFAAGAAILLAARPLQGPPALLWRPGAAWDAIAAPLRLTVDRTEIDRGEAVTVSVEAPGRRHAILWTRAPGESWRGWGLALDSLGRATKALGPLTSDRFLRLTSGGRHSDTLQVKVRIPAFLAALTVTARYPRYLGLDDEPISTAGDTVFVPAGTRLDTRGEATADLAGAAWEAPPQSARLTVAGNRFSGSFTPAGSRLYRLRLTTASGRPLAGDTIRLPVIAVPDSAPRVEVPVPGADTVAPLSLRVPLVVDVRDDHGVARVVLESRRISRLGFEDPPRLEPIPLPSPQPDRAVLSYELDLNARGLLPGDTVRYVVRVSDNAPAANVARSPEYALRLPTLSEIRQASRETADRIERRLDSLAQAGRSLERQTEDLARERPRQGSGERGQGAGEQALSFENARRAEAVAATQQELLRQAEEVKDALEALRQSAAAAGLDDPAWMERLAEIRQQLERALTPELREQLAELQRALQALDPDQTREALARLAEAQQKLREALERSRELFRRAAVEGEMANLTAEARDLEEAQRQWTERVLELDSLRADREERLLATRTDSLGSALKELAQDLAAEGEPRREAVAELGTLAEAAARAMRQAARSAARGQRQQAQQEGRQALEHLGSLGEELEGEREALQDQWREEILAAMDDALGETARLAERQLDLSEALRRGETGPAVRAEQGAVEEGVDRLLQKLKEISGKNALISPESSVALAAARDQMRQTRETLATAVPNGREAARRAGEAVDALNAAAHSLLRSRGAVSGSASGSGLAEAIEQMNRLAQQQGQLGQQGAGILPLAGTGAGQEQIRRLGAHQRALAERLERLRAGGAMPGAAELAQEAKELARHLEAGRLDRQTVERQERLFRRMLDAGRTLQGREEDENKERQSTTARDDSVHLPPALRARLGLGADRFRLPSWEALQALSPDERRMVVEYFRKLAEPPDGKR